jgi:hypothetical protein
VTTKKVVTVLEFGQRLVDERELLHGVMYTAQITQAWTLAPACPMAAV